VTVDHNTIIAPNGSGVLTVGGMTAEQFVFANNVAPHNDYGILGTDWGVGNGPIEFYLPGSVITRNVSAGGEAPLYPAGNEFPTVAEFQKHFVNYAAGNVSLVAGTDLGAQRHGWPLPGSPCPERTFQVATRKVTGAPWADSGGGRTNARANVIAGRRATIVRFMDSPWDRNSVPAARRGGRDGLDTNLSRRHRATAQT
jgi:hypothetical protein